MNAFHKRRSVLLCILSTFAFIVIFGISKGQHKIETQSSPSMMRRETSVNIGQHVRPVMHTFFEPHVAGEEALVAVWETEWQRAGFDTKVLTLKDAKKHPYFKTMDNIVKRMHGHNYNALCFFRWLAMATSGGGWMSDYDTFPTNFPSEEALILPHMGQFTSFGSQVPCLLSGSAEEWTRVSKLLVEAIPRITYKMKSDMHALVVLKHESNHDIEDHHIQFMDANKFVTNDFHYKMPRQVDCDAMSIGKVVHLSHRATNTAVKKRFFPVKSPNGDVAHHRSKAVTAFLEDWRTQCLGRNAEGESKKVDNQ